MKRKPPLFQLIFFLATLLLSPCGPFEGSAASRRAPDPGKVKVEHRKLLEEFGFFKKFEKKTGEKTGDAKKAKVERTNDDNKAGESFLDFLASLKHLSLPLIIIIVLALIALFYFSLRGVSRFFPAGVDKTREKKPTEEGGDDGDKRNTGGDHGYETALELAKKGEYGKALVLLHKSTLEKLRENRFIPAADHFTNNEIKGMIKDAKNGIYHPFSRLATAAERVAFKREEPAEDTYMVFKKMYEEWFLGLKNASGGQGLF